jgi:hypothetical protein
MTISTLKVFLAVKGIPQVMAGFVVNQPQWQTTLGGCNQTFVVRRQTLSEIFGTADVEFSISF